MLLFVLLGGRCRRRLTSGEWRGWARLEAPRQTCLQLPEVLDGVSIGLPCSVGCSVWSQRSTHCRRLVAWRSGLWHCQRQRYLKRLAAAEQGGGAPAAVALAVYPAQATWRKRCGVCTHAGGMHASSQPECPCLRGRMVAASAGRAVASPGRVAWRTRPPLLQGDQPDDV